MCGRTSVEVHVWGYRYEGRSVGVQVWGTNVGDWGYKCGGTSVGV